MPNQPKNFYLTTPIYYVNARPHIGHAYSTIVADVLARRHRLLGDETYFLTGTDEHGQKIERSAAAAGVPPQQFADQVSKTFADLWARMGITHDQFIRTTDAKHKLGAQQLFRTLYERGDIYLSSYTGQYSIGEEMFVEGPPGTIGPDGRPTETVTEENFFFRLSKYQLPLFDLIESNQLVITPESSRNEVLSFIRGNLQNVLELSNEELGASHDEPLEILEAFDLAYKKGFLGKSGENLYYVPGALKDLSISRSSFTWGIPVPDDIQLAAGAKEKHVIYVWLDALANYITALGYGSEDTTLFDKFWPADIHLVGKEITRFHCVYWPAFLLAAGLPTPKQVTANGWLLFDNSKMSKSKGNVVRTETILDAFGTLCPQPLAIAHVDSTGLRSGELGSENDGALAPGTSLPTPHDRDLFAADVLRYYLLREIPFGQDGSFSFDSLITRYNADLANGYGNLVSRVLKLIDTNCQSKIPSPLLRKKSFIQILLRGLPRGGHVGHPADHGPFVEVEEFDVARTAAVSAFFFERAFENQIFSMDMDFAQLRSALNDKNDVKEGTYGALDYVNLLISTTDAYISDTQPWKLAKSNDDESRSQLADTLYTAAESIRIITALLYPILPYATARVWHQLGLGDIEAAAANGELKNLTWGGLQPGTKLGPLGPIFPRADKGLAQTMADIEEKLQTPSPKPETESQTPQPPSTTSPDAGPRTASLTEPLATLPVAGSTAHTTGPANTPSHTEVAGSGIFATPPAAPDTSAEITIDDFAKIELRVAEIKVAERIPKADKLLRLEVDLGPHGTRQILSGIAEFYTPEELIGRRIIVITNLAPRKMRGLESHGMLLAASDIDHGKPHLATCGPEIALGSRLK